MAKLLMSIKLKPGKGRSKIVRTSVGRFTEVLGAINMDGELVAVFANPVQRHYQLTLRNPGITGDVIIEFYSGDGTTDPSKPVKIYEKTVEENEITLNINMASGSPDQNYTKQVLILKKAWSINLTSNPDQPS